MSSSSFTSPVFIIISMVVALSLTPEYPSVNGSKILGVFPHHGWSHFMMFEPLMLELAGRGHQVTVISRFPQKTTVANYTDIDVRRETLTDLTGNLTFGWLNRIPTSLYADLLVLYTFFRETETILEQPEVRQILGDDASSFDLLITETFNSRLFYGFAYRVNVPMITMSSSILLPWSAYDVGNPYNPAYWPFPMGAVSHKGMSFVERLVNTVEMSISILAYELIFDTAAERIARKHFGLDVPPLTDLAKNSSVTFVNTHFTLNGPLPLQPNVVEVGGIAVKPSKPLPKVSP